jgi:uncharacterized protein YggE
MMGRLRIALFLLATLAAITPPALAGEMFQRTITVSGQGKAVSPPDMAIIQTGVITHGAGAREALSGNNEAMEKVMEVLKAHKIAPEDIQTSGLNVTPEYRRDDRGLRDPENSGYRVTNQLQVRIRNLPDLGQILDALVACGSNQLYGINFQVEDATEVYNQARSLAVEDARRRAELYALASGVLLGKVLAIREQSIETPRPPSLARGFAAEAVSSVPVAPGEHEFQITVNIVFALEDKP